MSGPEALFLDVGGVFHLPDDDRVSDALARAGVEADPDRYERAHYLGIAATDGLAPDAPSAEIWETFVGAYCEGCGVPAGRRPAAREALAAAFREPGMWSKARPRSVEALGSLAATGVRLAIVSNSDGTLEERLRAEGICQVGEGPGTPVQAVVDSGKVGVEKPDQAIFRIALERTEALSERAVHVGDSVRADVRGAKGAGLAAVHFDPLELCADTDHDHVHDLHELSGRLRR